MPAINQQALRVAAGAYAAARHEYDTAKAVSEAAHRALEASPETIEYQIDWNVARREEAAAAWRLKQAEQAYRATGGYLEGDEDD